MGRLPKPSHHEHSTAARASKSSWSWRKWMNVGKMTNFMTSANLNGVSKLKRA
jgi:hypothetical protein